MHQERGVRDESSHKGEERDIIQYSNSLFLYHFHHDVVNFQHHKIIVLSNEFFGQI